MDTPAHPGSAGDDRTAHDPAGRQQRGDAHDHGDERPPAGREQVHDHLEAVYPPGIAASAHALGPYLYRTGELVLTAADPQGFDDELRRLQQLLSTPALQRRVLWDLLVYRLFLPEFPRHDRTPGTLLTQLLATLRLLLVALLHGMRLPLAVEVRDGGDERRAARVLRLSSVADVPDLVPVLVQRLRGLALPRGTRRPAVLPHHVLWASAHPMGFSAAPPRPPSESEYVSKRPLDLPAENDGRQPVVVAVVDSGVFATLPWFRPGIGGYVEDLADPGDVPPPLAGHALLPTFAGHGTFLAGTVLDEALRSRADGARGVQVLSTVVTDADGYFSDATAAAALDRLTADIRRNPGRTPAAVLLAWGGYTHDGAGLPQVECAVADLVAAAPGLAVIAAAGNDGERSRLVYPACLDAVVGVATYTPQGQPPTPAFTNGGTWVDACTEGVDLLGPFPEVDDVTPTEVMGHPADEGAVDFRGWAVWSGTSMSAARIAGAVARVIATSPEPLTGREAWALLRDGGTPVSAQLGVYVETGHL
jgi:hypothetical protein